MSSFLRKFWPAITWCLVILLLTGLPGTTFPKIESFWEWLAPDKLVHVFIFGMMSFLILFGAKEQYFKDALRYKVVFAAIGFTLLYGLFTEVMQAYVFVGRDGNAFDFFADSLGAIAGWLVFTIKYKKISHKQ